MCCQKLNPLTLSRIIEHHASPERDDDVNNCLLQFKDEISRNLPPLVDLFLGEGHAVSPTFRFWEYFSEIRFADNQYVHQLHQAMHIQLLLFLFNYARYLTVNNLLMIRLQIMS